MGENKKYVVYGMMAKCSEGTMENYISTDKGHGIIFQGQPVLNANDHLKGINLTHFGDCNSREFYEQAKKEADEKLQAGEEDSFFMKAAKKRAQRSVKAVAFIKEHLMFNKCELDTPLPWIFTSEDHMIDGAPALTLESQCPCRYGGIITIVLQAEEVTEAEELTEEKEDDMAAAFEQMLQETYGFDKEQAKLISSSYLLFMENEENQKLSRKEQMHKYFSAMAGLCLNYSGGAKRWRLISDTMATTDAIEYFESLGMSEQEAFDLMGAINFQHSGGELLSKPEDYNSQGFCSNKDCDRNCGYKYHITDSKYWNFDYGDGGKENDFAHELIQYATFSNDDSSVHKLWDFCGVFGDIEAMASYKGDIYSTRAEKEDMVSDIDAANLYRRFETSEDCLLKIMTDYRNQVSSGEINRSEEFLMNLGNGNVEDGYRYLEEELNNVDIASQYLAPDHGGVKSIIQDAAFYNALSAFSGIKGKKEFANYSNRAKVKDNIKINKKKEEFLDYVSTELENGGKET